jgi:1-acyl-sn-glycerol-3-phosphate acyltransferase
MRKGLFSKLAMAPEGTRRRKLSDGSEETIRELKKGPFYVAKDLKADIVPILLEGAHRLNYDAILANPGTICFN